MIRRHPRGPSSGRRVLASVAGAAAGVTAMDAVSYLDMLIRGRPASDVPSTVASRITGRLHVRLGDEQASRNRSTALGALLGSATGLTVAIGYGLLRKVTRPLPRPAAGLLVGAAAMVASDTPIVLSGLSDPRRWGTAGWMSDIVPHAVYGMTAVAVHEALIRRSG